MGYCCCTTQLLIAPPPRPKDECVPPLRRLRLLLRHSAETNHDGNDDDDDDPRREFLDTMDQTRDSPSFVVGGSSPLLPSLDGAKQQQQQQQNHHPRGEDPLMGYTLQDLEAYAAAAAAASLAALAKQQGGGELLSHGGGGGDGMALPDSTIIMEEEKNTENNNDNFDDDDDSLFLDPDVYVQSRERLNPDGSLSEETTMNAAVVDDTDIGVWPDDESVWSNRMDATTTINNQRYRDALQNFLETVPNAPDSSIMGEAVSGIPENSIGDDPTLEDLWSVVRQQQQPPPRGGSPGQRMAFATSSEELHRQVFAQEGGFLENSAVFLESLTDATKADRAVAERRGRLYRERQQQAIAELEEQIAEFEATLLQQPQQHAAEQAGNEHQHYCSQCHCFMSEDEFQAAAAAAAQVRTSAQNISSADLLCRVCYKDVLVAKSKQAARDEAEQRQRRARALVRSFRQTGTVASISTTAAAAARPRSPTTTTAPRDSSTANKNINNSNAALPPRPRPNRPVAAAVSTRPPSPTTSHQQQHPPARPRPPVQPQKAVASGVEPPRVDAERPKRATTNNAAARPNLPLFVSPVASEQTPPPPPRQQPEQQQRRRQIDVMGQQPAGVVVSRPRDDRIVSSDGRPPLPPPVTKEPVVAPRPWLAVVDPDTMETFYWNEETEEMRWEL